MLTIEYRRMSLRRSLKHSALDDGSTIEKSLGLCWIYLLPVPLWQHVPLMHPCMSLMGPTTLLRTHNLGNILLVGV